MKPAFTLVASTLAISIGAVDAHAEPSRSYDVYADVTRVEPLIERRIVHRDKRVCSQDTYRSPDAYRGEYGRRGRHEHRHENSRSSYRDYGYDDGRHYSTYSERRHGPGAAIVGGILGGLIGHQFGGGNGKDLLTIGGAVAGAALADRAARGRTPRDVIRRPRREQRYQSCWTESKPQTINSIQGYRVTYAYQGRTFSRVMDSHPGDKVHMNVQVSDVD